MRFNRSWIHHPSLLSALAVLFALVPSRIQPSPIAFPQGTSRKIVSDDFTKNRQETTTATASTKTSQGQSPLRPKPRRTYRLASQPAKKTGLSSPGSVIAQLGVTIWRLRAADSSDAGGRALIREKGKSSSWAPERVEADTTFREGDHVRLSIESPRAGYLYVVDRDLFADGTTGGAMLIYPWTEADNLMRPGRLVDIPAQDDDPSYFTARLTSPNQVGELLTIIVTSAPLDLPISDRPFQISNVQMSKWEKIWGGQSERFEMEGGAGEAWTQQEQQAAAKKGTRQLTRDDPAPQTIYRVP
ncbi:MAG: hypothetical protein ACMG6H_14910, partial [Acidobacteriota bacterium]